jgi:tRNA threonylcarbamoyladenosine biosynthesis protein TsaB
VVLAVIDARRGEAFAAAWAGAERVLAPSALAPEALARAASDLGAGGADPWLAVGDGAVRFAEILVTAGVAVPPGDSPLHRVSAAAICRLGAAATPSAPSAVLPEYLREPDARLKRRPDGR